MRLAVDQHQSEPEVVQPGPPLSAWIRNVVVGAIRWLIELTALTETDQLEAGVFMGHQGRDR
jgi:hypothetical protein